MSIPFPTNFAPFLTASSDRKLTGLLNKLVPSNITGTCTKIVSLLAFGEESFPEEAVAAASHVAHRIVGMAGTQPMHSSLYAQVCFGVADSLDAGGDAERRGHQFVGFVVHHLHEALAVKEIPTLLLFESNLQHVGLDVSIFAAEGTSKDDAACDHLDSTWVKIPHVHDSTETILEQPNVACGPREPPPSVVSAKEVVDAVSGLLCIPAADTEDATSYTAWLSNVQSIAQISETRRVETEIARAAERMHRIDLEERLEAAQKRENERDVRIRLGREREVELEAGIRRLELMVAALKIDLVEAEGRTRRARDTVMDEVLALLQTKRDGVRCEGGVEDSIDSMTPTVERLHLYA
ncbi:unnamed protein product [Mycena citricolor]|uniref:Uncharacterized protein n=1 Tax=Mycena citricolor TaxID=2018698 RepID=A0AAD2GR14_9AGAR|nr:unnamed protein product [Mycena citricolor]